MCGGLVVLKCVWAGKSRQRNTMNKVQLEEAERRAVELRAEVAVRCAVEVDHASMTSPRAKARSCASTSIRSESTMSSRTSYPGLPM